MQERIYILKKGTEVPAQFDGVTIPFTVPGSLGEVLRVAGASEELVQNVARLEATLGTPDLAARNNAVAIFNQAHALNVQKDAKVSAMEEGATVDSIRKGASDFKYGQVRVRGAATPKVPTAASIQQTVGDDFLSLLTPEQRAIWDAKMASLKAATPAKTPEAPAATEAPKAAEAPKNGSKKGK